MNALKTLLLATVCAVAISSPALANGKTESGSMWEGGYVGLQAGAGFGITEHTDLDDWYEGNNDFGTTDTGFIGGAKAGYDWTNGNTIYGLFAEYSFANIDTVQETDPINGPEYAAGSEIDGLGSIRGKLGLTSGDFAGFFSLGLGYQNADDIQYDTDGSTEGISQDSDDWGWAFGFGADYSIGNNGFIGFDASHYIFGKETHEVMDGGVPQGYFFTFDNTVTTGTISYTYKFN